MLSAYKYVTMFYPISVQKKLDYDMKCFKICMKNVGVEFFDRGISSLICCL